MALSNADRLAQNSMVPPLAKEVTAQIATAAGTAAWAGITGKPAVIAAGATAAAARTVIEFDASAKAAVAAKTEVAALAAVTVTATTGTLPTPNGSVTIVNAATPTVVELQEFCMENRAKIAAIIAALKA